MKQDAKPTLTPKLRFPEFREAEGWKETKLKDVLTEHGLKSDGTSEVYSVSVHKGVVNQKEHLGRSFAAADTSDYNLSKPFDIIYTKSPTGDFPYGVVKQNHNKWNVIVSPLYGVFSPANKYIGYLLDAYFESPIRTNNYLAPITQKGAKNTIQIPNETFLSNGLYLPRKEGEQQKIADCLSSLDELICVERQRLDFFKAHKKGLMQELFPGEGETLPHLRMPEFRNGPEWEKKSIGDLGEVITGNTPSTARREYYDGEYLFVSPGDISDLRFVEKSKTTLSPLGITQTRPIKAKSVLFVCIGSTIGKVAQNLQECATNQQINSIIPGPEFSGDFIYYILSKNSELIAKLAGIQAVPIINKTLFSSVKIAFPELGEQKRIADCLSSLDDLIAAQTQKITGLKTHKAGLMQWLFPSQEATEA
jgi:type I restriction enzyme, S subunit